MRKNVKKDAGAKNNTEIDIKTNKKRKAIRKASSPNLKKEKISQEKYLEAIGRRKTAIARIRLFDGKGEIIINNKKLNEYFPVKFHQEVVLSPLKLLKLLDKVKISALVKGGGVSAQAEALRLGISRVLVKLNEEYRKRLKAVGFLTRDSRVRERKKPGLKRARRAPQWSKR